MIYTINMKIEHLLAISGLALLLAGCNEDSLPQMPDNALRLQSVEVAGDSSTSGATRAQTTAAPVTKIGVYLTTYQHASRGQYPYELKSGTWSCSSTPPDITATEAQADLAYAFFPSDATVTNSSSGAHTIPVKVAASDFSLTSQTDYLYAGPKTAHAGSRSVSFEMNHALAKVSFNILKSATVTETLTLHQVEILSGTNRLQQGNSGTLNLNTGKLNGLASTGSLVFAGSTELKALQDQPNVSCLVAPMTSVETKLSFRLSVRVAGEAEDRVFETAAVSGNVLWEAGTHYIYRMTVDKMGGSLTGIKIDGWKNDANQNTGIGI